MYVFGGLTKDKELKNDLWVVRPYFKKNKEIMDPKRFEFPEGEEPRFYYELARLEPEGRAPVARYGHSMVHLRRNLFVFGGRNDAIYATTSTICLNDLNVYNIERNRWEPIAMFGKIPCSRMGLAMSTYESKIILFGGIKLDGFVHPNQVQFFEV